MALEIPKSKNVRWSILIYLGYYQIEYFSTQNHFCLAVLNVILYLVDFESFIQTSYKPLQGKDILQDPLVKTCLW